MFQLEIKGRHPLPRGFFVVKVGLYLTAASAAAFLLHLCSLIDNLLYVLPLFPLLHLFQVGEREGMEGGGGQWGFLLSPPHVYVVADFENLCPRAGLPRTKSR